LYNLSPPHLFVFPTFIYNIFHIADLIFQFDEHNIFNGKQKRQILNKIMLK